MSESPSIANPNPPRIERRKLSDPTGLAGVNLNYLIPGEASPCDIFLYFRWIFVEVVRKGEIVSLPTYAKVRNDFFSSGFILAAEQPAWENWKRLRHPQTSSPTTQAAGPNTPASTISKGERTGTPARALEFQSYAFSKVDFQAKTDIQQAQVQAAREALRKASENQMVSWFFKMLSVEDSLFHHNARVTYLALLFATTSIPKLASEQLETLALSTLLHELEGDPEQNRTLAPSSERTLKILAERKQPLPESITDILHQQDELYDGSGSPRGLKGTEIHLITRVFALANHFDHYRISHRGGTRRIRLERAKTLMSAKSTLYDPALWAVFWPFVEKVEILE